MKSIRAKMLCTIIPILLISMGFLLLSSVVSSTETITDQTKEKMNSELRGQSNSIDSELQGVSTVAYNIA